MRLPEEFIETTRRLFGEERWQRFVEALDEEPCVAVRVNRQRGLLTPADGGEQVPWCPEGCYLERRPNFTMDPLLHAGCYYVQEAASMFVSHVLRQWVQRPVRMLDMCAAPGGKSTAARQALPEGSVLVSNEPIRQRACILLENMTKWGAKDCIVTNNYPKDFARAKARFDVVLCDVPCSGEGMFRKDPKAIGEWSPQNVERCQQLQREIVSEAWKCLNEGGLFIYSTCTYNIKEDEENVRWMTEELGADVLPVETQQEWGITGSLLEGFTKPVYRFIPGLTRGEGLFMAVLKKGKDTPTPQTVKAPDFLKKLKLMERPTPWLGDEEERAEVDYRTAMSYLRGEAIVLPGDVSRGLVALTFMGQPLGLVKNIGTRANNLYPKEWRIKTTHIPERYEAILRPAGPHPA